jgi:hypothetical protein
MRAAGRGPHVGHVSALRDELELLLSLAADGRRLVEPVLFTAYCINRQGDPRSNRPDGDPDA